jgi:hypothetical protein
LFVHFLEHYSYDEDAKEVEFVHRRLNFLFILIGMRLKIRSFIVDRLEKLFMVLLLNLKSSQFRGG